MTNSQLAAVLGHAQSRTTERYSAIARSHQQRLGRIAFDAAMGNLAEPQLTHPGGENVRAISNKR